MATAAVEQPFVMKKFYDTELARPKGSWFEPYPAWTKEHGFYPPDRVEGAKAGIPLAQHSGDDPSAALLNDPEWRQQHLTIYGLAKLEAEQRAKTDPNVAMAQHNGAAIDPFSYILGEAPYMMSRGLDMKRTDTWNIPTPLAGQPSPKLDATIEHLVTAQSNELWDHLVPTRKIDINNSNVVHWTVIEHQPAMARETTPLGLPTMVDARAHTEKQELSLYAIGGRIGIGFWMTEMGTRHWLELLFSIASGIVAASQFSAAIAIASTESRYMRLMREVKSGFKPTLDYAHDNLASTFALFQHPSHNYFTIMMTKLQDQARIKNAEGGAYVLVTTPEAVIALMKGNKDGIAYHTSGPGGPEMLKKEVISRQRIYDTDVYAVPSFRMPNGRMEQPFAIPFEIGERIEFFDETAEGGKFDIRSMNRRIFTRERGWVEVTFRDAIKNLSCWDVNGDLIPSEATPRPHSDSAPKWFTDQNGHQLLYAYYPFSIDNNTVKKTITAPGFPLSRDEALALYDIYASPGEIDAVKTARLYRPVGKRLKTAVPNPEDTPAEVKTEAEKVFKECGKWSTFPFQIIALQLHQRGFGHYAYYMLPGRVVYRVRKEGHAVVEDSFEQHIHQVSCQYAAGAAVVFPKNLVEARNVFIAQTERGYGVEPIHPSKAGYGDRYEPNDLDGGVQGDIIYIAVPSKQYYKVDQVPRNLNVRGIIAGDLTQIYIPPEDMHANSYPGWAYQDSLYGWTAMKCGMIRQREFPDAYRTMDFPVNIVCRQACYQLYSIKKEQYTIIREGNGYWKFEGLSLFLHLLVTL